MTVNFGLDIYLFNILVSFLIGIPFGLIFPVRAKYLIIDFAAGVIFFISIAVVRSFEHVFDLDILLLGIKYCIFLLGAGFAASRWNKTAREKEKIVKILEKNAKE